MDLQAVTVDRATARQAVADYRRALKERHDAEDEAMLRAYRASLKGLSLIRLTETVRLGGTDTIEAPDSSWSRRIVVASVPRIAVARADQPFVWTQGVSSAGGLRLEYQPRRSHNRATRTRFSLPTGTFDEETRAQPWSPCIRAVVPPVPPALRPAHHLRNYHVLWEAEWAIDRTVPPVDPALLKHLGGDLYAVLAVWDLSPVEQAVLAGREPA